MTVIHKEKKVIAKYDKAAVLTFLGKFAECLQNVWFFSGLVFGMMALGCYQLHRTTRI